MVNLVRRVVVARGDDDRSRRETTKRCIAMKDIAYRNRLRPGIEGRFFLSFFWLTVPYRGFCDR